MCLQLSLIIQTKKVQIDAMSHHPRPRPPVLFDLVPSLFCLRVNEREQEGEIDVIIRPLQVLTHFLLTTFSSSCTKSQRQADRQSDGPTEEGQALSASALQVILHMALCQEGAAAH